MSMKKRLFSVFMAIAMLISMLPVYAAAENDVLEEAGLEEAYDPEDQNYDLEEEPHDHIPAEEGIVIDPTCTEQGYILYTCSICGENFSEMIPELGHSYDEGTVTAEPTCTEPGIIVFTCSRCGESYSETVAARGHSYDEGTVTIEPTCTKPGTKTFTCSRCGDSYTETIAAIGHDYNSGVVSEDGKIAYTCVRCGDSYTETVPVFEDTEESVELREELPADEVFAEPAVIRIDRQPSDAKVEDGAAEFSVSASVQPEDEELSYQWQRISDSPKNEGDVIEETEWEDLPDETESTLRIDGLSDTELLKSSAMYRYRCRISAGETVALTDEVRFATEKKSFENNVITGFAKLEPEEIVKEYKPVLKKLEDDFPETIVVSLGGEGLYIHYAEGKKLLLAVENAESKEMPVTWNCVQDYDDHLAVFEFVPTIEGYELADGLSLPILQFRINGSAPTQPLGEIEEVQINLPAGGDGLVIEETEEMLRGLPSAYRTSINNLPPVRNQKPYGSCWAFASIGSVETDLLHDGYSADLSELYLAYYMYHNYPEFRNETKDSVSFVGSGHYLDVGGTKLIALRMMANGVGPVSENDAPYPHDTNYSGKPGGTAAARVTGVKIFHPDNSGAIKEAIMAHGGVTASIYVEQYETYPHEYKWFSYKEEEPAFYCPDKTSTNHSIMLVGWDDNYPKENFRKDATPPGNGAWLVRNSWGTEPANNPGQGYFWMSYYDKAYNSDIVTSFDATLRHIYTYCYAYNDNTPYGYSSRTVPSNGFISQSFKLVGAETVKAVGFETLSTSLSGTATVSAVLKDGSTRSTSVQIKTSYMGFYLFELSNPLDLPAGANVTITLKFNQDAAIVVDSSGSESREVSGGRMYYDSYCDNGYTINNRSYSDSDSSIKLYTDPSSMAAPKITAQPKSVTVTEGSQATFTVGASGSGLSYQWIYIDSNGKWVESGASGNKTPTLKITATKSLNGMQFFCVVKNSGGEVRSSRATLTVSTPIPAPKITAQPKSVTVSEGSQATFTVGASGSGLSYQWIYIDSNGKWVNSGASGNKTPTLKITATKSLNGMQFFCVVKNSGGEVRSNRATLTVSTPIPAPKITTQPKSVTVSEGSQATFTVGASGSNLSYQWIYIDSNGKWVNSGASGNKTPTLKITATKSLNGLQFFCVVKNSGGEVRSSRATLTVSTPIPAPPKITSQPRSTSVYEGDQATFTVGASGSGLSYQWIYIDANGKWVNSGASGNKTATLRITGTSSLNGMQFFCAVKNGAGEVRSNRVTLTVNKQVVPTITTQPKSTSVYEGTQATFTVGARGGGLSYQWQYKESNGVWVNSGASGNKTTTLRITGTNNLNKLQFRCKVSNSRGTVYSNTVTLTVTRESGWVLPSQVPANATITQTSYSYRESTESTSSSMSGWTSNGNYWKQTGSGSAYYASFPSGYNTSDKYYKNYRHEPYSGSETATQKRTVTNSKDGYIYWHWMYNVKYASGMTRAISSKEGSFGSKNYWYGYFYSMVSTVDCASAGTGYCNNQNVTSYNAKKVVDAVASSSDKTSPTSGLGTDRFFRITRYKSTYTDYTKYYRYYRDLQYQSADPGNGSNISNKVTYVKYRIN